MSGLWRRYRRLPRNVFAIGLVSLMNDASSEVIYPLLPIFLTTVLAGLDGTDTVWSVGVRRKVGSRLLLGVSYERGNLTFVNEGTLRDATSEGMMGSAFLDRSRLDVNVYAGYRKLRPAAGSSFAGYDGPSGGASVSWALSRLFSLNVFARSNLVSSIYGESAMYDERRVGGGLGISQPERRPMRLGSPFVLEMRMYPAMADGYRFLTQGTPGPPAFLLVEGGRRLDQRVTSIE